ncbi:MAG TPA: hypothetical protein VK586_04430, partial [Streptosporangiaceae bacterium]|nr:hypothetical protein [Streptosporangiaceae bacterium]
LPAGRRGRVVLVVQAERAGQAWADRLAARYPAVEVTVSGRHDAAAARLSAERVAAYQELEDRLAVQLGQDQRTLRERERQARDRYREQRNLLLGQPAEDAGEGLYDVLWATFGPQLQPRFSNKAPAASEIGEHVQAALRDDFARYLADVPGGMGGAHPLTDALMARGVAVDDQDTRQKLLDALVTLATGEGAIPDPSVEDGLVDVAALVLGWTATVLGPGSARHAGDPGAAPAVYLDHAGTGYRVLPARGSEVLAAREFAQRVEPVGVDAGLLDQVTAFVDDHGELTAGDYQRARDAAADPDALAARVEPERDRLRQALAELGTAPSHQLLLLILTSYQKLAQLVSLADLSGQPPPPARAVPALAADPIGLPEFRLIVETPTPPQSAPPSPVPAGAGDDALLTVPATRFGGDRAALPGGVVTPAPASRFSPGMIVSGLAGRGAGDVSAEVVTLVGDFLVRLGGDADGVILGALAPLPPEEQEAGRDWLARVRAAGGWAGQVLRHLSGSPRYRLPVGQLTVLVVRLLNGLASPDEHAIVLRLLSRSRDQELRDLAAAGGEGWLLGMLVSRIGPDHLWHEALVKLLDERFEEDGQVKAVYLEEEFRPGMIGAELERLSVGAVLDEADLPLVAGVLAGMSDAGIRAVVASPPLSGLAPVERDRGTWWLAYVRTALHARLAAGPGPGGAAALEDDLAVAVAVLDRVLAWLHSATVQRIPGPRELSLFSA